MGKKLAPEVSIIIPSHRSQYIDELVSQFDYAVCGHIPIEIIVVADYSIIEYEKKYHHVRWIHIPEKSISLKRNRGILSARSDICAFIDDDCIPGEKWIHAALEYFKTHPNMAGVEGLTKIGSCTQKQGSLREFKRLETRGFRTNNIFYRKKHLLSVNLFDERFIIQREDVDLAYSLLEVGLKIGYSTTINVTHRYRANEKWDLLKNCFNRRFDPLLFYKHTTLYHHFIGNPIPPGIQILGMMHLFLIIGSVTLDSVHYLIICLDIILILILTLRRAGIPFNHNSFQWVCEYVSFTLSPFVLTASLLYGSIRFRSFDLMIFILSHKMRSPNTMKYKKNRDIKSKISTYKLLKQGRKNVHL